MEPERPNGHSTTSSNVPGNVLFATFKSPAESGIPGIEAIAKVDPSLFPQLNLPQGVRIAVTPSTTAEGGYVWTFVPNAKGQSSAVEESNDWPKRVNVLGELKMIDREEWDQFKINPEYEVIVPSSGAIPIVNQRGQTSTTPPPFDPTFVQSPTPPQEPAPRTPTPKPSAKRTASGPVDVESPRKKQRTYVEAATETESSESEIGEVQKDAFEAKKKKLKREYDKEKNRGQSREFTREETPAPWAGSWAAHLDDNTSYAREGREKFAMDTDPIQVKRRTSAETEIPSAKRRKQSEDIDAKLRAYHRAASAGRRRTPSKRPKQGKEEIEKDFWQGVNFEGIRGRVFNLAEDDARDSTPNVKPDPVHEPASESQSQGDPIFVEDSDNDDLDGFHTATSEDSDAYHENRFYAKGKGRAMEEEDDEDPESRYRRLEESRRKIEELNALDPQHRAHQQRQEEARRRAEQQRQAEERRQRAKKEEEERLRREAEKRRREREQQQRSRAYGAWGSFDFEDHFRTRAPWGDDYDPYAHTSHSGTRFSWAHGSGRSGTGWSGMGTKSSPYEAGSSPRRSAQSKPKYTPQQALERYNKLSEVFDNFKSSSGNVPTFEQIPWPVLFAPGFTLEQIDWNAVEAFFKEAEVLMGGKTYGKAKWKEFVKSSTRRFHPDRWRARGIIGDKGHGDDVEEKVNHVAKVLTPLYRAID